MSRQTVHVIAPEGSLHGSSLHGRLPCYLVEEENDIHSSHKFVDDTSSAFDKCSEGCALLHKKAYALACCACLPVHDVGLKASALSNGSRHNSAGGSSKLHRTAACHQALCQPTGAKNGIAVMAKL